MDTTKSMDWVQLLNPTRIDEKNVQKQSRSVFEQDYDRIIFSQSFRSLQDKTQVFPLAGQEFAHTRLTHSLEVASVGRSLGREAGRLLLEKYPQLSEGGISSHDFGAVVAAAALAHDIGNPPFGHAGEAGISDFFQNASIASEIRSVLSEKEWQDISQFEGNAQGFRLLNKNKRQGLNLSGAILGAFSKYPCESLLIGRDKSRKSQKKYGFHQANQEDFRFIASTLGLLPLGESGLSWCRHPLAFLVEAADDICYTIIDLEDGTMQGWISFKETEELLGELIGERYQPEKLVKYPSLTEKTGMLRALAISVLIEQVVKKFIEVEPEMMTGSFDKALTGQIPVAPQFERIQQISVEKIYRSKAVIEREAAGFEVLHGLLVAFVPGLVKEFKKESFSWKENCLWRLLPPDASEEISQQQSLYTKLLSLLDFVSGLTDSKALSLFRNIRGISIPGS